MTDLSIKRLIDKDEFTYTLKKPLKSDILPDISKRLLFIIYGSKGTSKTTLLMNLLYNPNFYESQFSMKYYIAPTIYSDNNLFPARSDPDAILIDKYSDEAINEIVKNQTIGDDMTIDDIMFSALILEDALADGGTSSNNSAIAKLTTIMRHRFLNVFIVAQTVNQIASVIRSQANIIFLKKIRSTKELDKFESQYASMIGGEKYFRKMYNYVFSKPENKFDFLYIDLDNFRVYHNFDKILYENEKEYI
tara:strand:- start:23 stop:769 length:747 start_codon:yes stop_codon:yes gene_type:complete